MSHPSLPTVRLRVDVSSPEEWPAAQMEDAVRHLQQDLRELHVAAIQPISEASTPGNKGDALTLGSFLVALAPELVKQTLTLFVDWLRRNPTRVIKIRSKKDGPEYEISGSWKAADLEKIMKVLAAREAEGDPRRE